MPDTLSFLILSDLSIVGFLLFLNVYSNQFDFNKDKLNYEFTSMYWVAHLCGSYTLSQKLWALQKKLIQFSQIK